MTGINFFEKVLRSVFAQAAAATQYPKQTLESSERCGNCRYFFDEAPGQPVSTVCRRYPKSYFLESPKKVHFHTGHWEWSSPCGYPYVEPQEWCGEWKAQDGV